MPAAQNPLGSPSQVFWSNTCPHTLDVWEEQNVVGGRSFFKRFFFVFPSAAA